jgi:hypothetical protein
LKLNRLPAPTLFVGPPSRNTSQLSVSRQVLADPSRSNTPRDKRPTSLIRQHSALSTASTIQHNEHASSASPTKAEAPSSSTHLRKLSNKSVDARWHSMQTSLNETEFSARAQESTRIFGAAHAAALDALRTAQIELARAWGRGKGESEERDENDAATDMGFDVANSASVTARKRGDTATSVSTFLSDESVSESNASETNGSGRMGMDPRQLEDDTLADIQRASERRKLNERYFKMVERSVRDVGDKLEGVASAMRGVEGEGRALWGDGGVK